MRLGTHMTQKMKNKEGKSLTIAWENRKLKWGPTGVKNPIEYKTNLKNAIRKRKIENPASFKHTLSQNKNIKKGRKKFLLTDEGIAYREKCKLQKNNFYKTQKGKKAKIRISKTLCRTGNLKRLIIYGKEYCRNPLSRNKKISMSNKGRTKSINPWIKRKERYGISGLKNPHETRNKQRITILKTTRTPEYREFCRKRNKKLYNKNPEKYKKIGLDFAKRTRKTMGFNKRIKKTSIEVKTEKIINALKLPYKFTGLGTVWIENMNPDFFNINGEKKVIEVLGSYWHNKEETKQRANNYKKYGYRMLSIWDYELENEVKVSNKILKFNKL